MLNPQSGCGVICHFSSRSCKHCSEAGGPARLNWGWRWLVLLRVSRVFLQPWDWSGSLDHRLGVPPLARSWLYRGRRAGTRVALQTAEPQLADVGGQPSRLQSPSASLQLCSCSSPVLFGHICGADPALPRHWGFEPGQMGCSGL